MGEKNKRIEDDRWCTLEKKMRRDKFDTKTQNSLRINKHLILYVTMLGSSFIYFSLSRNIENGQ